MAFNGYSDDFELDDDGILRDSSSTGGILIDDDGIVRDDYDNQSKYTARTTSTFHWTDSGLGTDKQSAGSTSTLRQFDLQSYPSLDELNSHPLEDSHVNISDLEASKDDLSFEGDNFRDSFDRDLGYDQEGISPTPKGQFHSGLSSRSSFDHSLTFDDTDNLKSTTESQKELFDADYYKQLEELGVLIDGTELPLPNPGSSLNEFEQLEHHVSNDDIKYEPVENDPLDTFLRKTPTRFQSPGPDQQSFSEYNDERQTQTRPSTANSARTISDRSFPEISPEEAYQIYRQQSLEKGLDNEEGDRVGESLNLVNEDAASLDFEHSQRTGDDDEIFIITSRISDAPKPAKLRAYGRKDDETPSVTLTSSRTPSRTSAGGDSRGNTPLSHDRKRPSSRSDSRTDSRLSNRSGTPLGNRPGTPHRVGTPLSREGSVTPSGRNSTGTQPFERTGSATPSYQSDLSRPNSVTSQKSENFSRSSPQIRNENQAMSKSRSQENVSNGMKGRGNDKMTKRLLPKPSASEMHQNLRVKSKSATNLAQKAGPMKPKHMSTTDLTHFEDTDGEHENAVKPGGDLSNRLSQEFHKRKQATELVQQLQKDYDKLLSKYAEAELTIDTLRLGARVTLHPSASPTPSQATSGSMASLQQAQFIQMNQTMSRGVKSPSPFQGSMGYASPLPDGSHGDVFSDRGARPKTKGQGHASEGTSMGMDMFSPTNDTNQDVERGAESTKITLMYQSKELDERMDSFKALLDENQLTHADQEKVFDKIRTDHEKLRREYLQTKEDFNVLKRSNANMEVNFDEEKELEGELFKLGMKFDEIHEQVESNMQKKASERQPFQPNQTLENAGADADAMDPAVDQMKKKMINPQAGSDLVHPRDKESFEEKVKQLHENYNALMDRYRRLKQMAQTPERDQEIDNLVRKLRQISQEEPEIFRLPSDIADRGRSNSIYTDVDDGYDFVSIRSDISQTGSDLNSESDMGRYEKIQERENRERSMSLRGSRDNPLQAGSMASVQNQSFTRGRDTPTNLHDTSMRSLQDMNGDIASIHNELRSNSRLQDQSGLSGSRNSLFSSRPNTPGMRDSFEEDSSNPRLPRPQRHHLRDPEKKRPRKSHGSSLASLQDSGISEHDGATGDVAAGNLSNLPGPGRFKEMTKSRHSHDADSGFVGSMVGSEVTQQQQEAAEPTLRLRQGSLNRSRDADEVSVTSSRSTRSNRSRPRSRTNDRPPSRGSDHGQLSDSRDFNDSYTYSESDMSFDSQHSRRSRDSRGRRRPSFEKTIKEEGEEAVKQKQKPLTIPQNHTPPVIRTPGKPKVKTEQTKPMSRSQMVGPSDEEVTPKATPNVSFNDTREVFSSGEDTPRVEDVSEEEVVIPKKVERVQRPPTPKKQEQPRAPTPKQEVKPKRPILQRQEMPRTEIEPPRMQDKEVGSDSDDTIEGSEAPTVNTRISESSERFKLLQDEISRLRSEFQKATEKQRQDMLKQKQEQEDQLLLQQRSMLQQQQVPPPAPPPAQPHDQHDDYYFDPTEDPYAFMRGPRRRANSFSGAGARDFDDWWKYPLGNPQADAEIPLGYAAADSFATTKKPVKDEQQPNARARARERVRRKFRRSTENAATSAATNGYDSDQSPTRAAATDEQLYNYYVPRYHHVATEPMVAAAAVTPEHPTNRRRGHYSSQPNLVYSSVGTETATANQSQALPSGQPHQQYVSTSANYSAPISAGYRTRRGQFSPASTPRYNLTSPRPSSGTTYSYDEYEPQPVAYVPVEHLPPEYGYSSQTTTQTSTCPMCGGRGFHTHTEHIQEAAPDAPIPVYYVRPSARRKVRQRSKSANRVRHYSPEGRQRTKYIVRDYRSESSSAESDDELYRARARSRGYRRRSGRKYRKSDLESALNQSLNLSEDIEEMTHKMMHTVKGELKKSKKYKEFGSSWW